MWVDDEVGLAVPVEVGIDQREVDAAQVGAPRGDPETQQRGRVGRDCAPGVLREQRLDSQAVQVGVAARLARRVPASMQPDDAPVPEQPAQVGTGQAERHRAGGREDVVVGDEGGVHVPTLLPRAPRRHRRPGGCGCRTAARTGMWTRPIPL